MEPERPEGCTLVSSSNAFPAFTYAAPCVLALLEQTATKLGTKLIQVDQDPAGLYLSARIAAGETGLGGADLDFSRREGGWTSTISLAHRRLSSLELTRFTHFLKALDEALLVGTAILNGET